MANKKSNNIIFNCREKEKLDLCLKHLNENGLNIDRTHILNELTNMFINKMYPLIKDKNTAGEFFNEFYKIGVNIKKN